jgi:hypothetical protein
MTPRFNPLTFWEFSHRNGADRDPNLGLISYEVSTPYRDICRGPISAQIRGSRQSRALGGLA